MGRLYLTEKGKWAVPLADSRYVKGALLRNIDMYPGQYVHHPEFEAPEMWGEVRKAVVEEMLEEGLIEIR